MEHSTVLLLVDIGIIATYALLGVALFGAVLSAIRGLFTNPKGAKMALFGLVGIAIVVGAAFGLSSGADISDILLDKTGTPQWWVRPIGAGLISFYILLFCTIAMVIGTEVLRPFKK